jgi:hypothetical protein
MKKWTMGLLLGCSLLLLSVDYNKDRIINDFAKVFTLETLEYNGQKNLMVGVNQGSDPEYGDFLKQYQPYLLMINQLAETYKVIPALKDLAADAAKTVFEKQLRTNPLLQKEMLPLMARYLQSSGRSVLVPLEPRPTYNIEAVMPIAARFFYPHLANEKFMLHMCVGINGLNTLSPEPPAALVAFSYHTIHKNLMAGRPEVSDYMALIKKRREENKGQEIQAFQKAVWDWLEKNQKLKELFIAEYQLLKDTLPFTLNFGQGPVASAK